MNNDFPNLKKKLEKLADRTVDKMKDQIKKAGKYNTGNLYNSVGWKYVEGGIEFYVAAPYAKYIISGRKKGSQPPTGPILKWFGGKNGRRAFANMRRRWKTLKPEQAAFIIARSIKKKGIKPFDFFNPHINTIYKSDSFHELEAAVVLDIEKKLKKI